MKDQQPADQRAGHYHLRAIEARTKAESMKDSEARRTMLLVAAMWDAMANALEAHSHLS